MHSSQLQTARLLFRIVTLSSCALAFAFALLLLRFALRSYEDTHMCFARTCVGG